MTYEISTQLTKDPRSLNDRLLEIEVKLAELSGPSLSGLTEVYSAPSKPRNGNIIFADGTQWDPGSGRGVYIYNGSTSAWVLWVAL